MDQTIPTTDEKREWQKPVLEELDISETKFGGGGAMSDISNTTTATRPS